MKDEMAFDTTPYEVEGMQACPAAYKQAEVMLAQLRRISGPQPEGVKWSIILPEHGTYYELRIAYEDTSSPHWAYIFQVSQSWPAHWDAEALAELAKVNVA